LVAEQQSFSNLFGEAPLRFYILQGGNTPLLAWRQYSVFNLSGEATFRFYSPQGSNTPFRVCFGKVHQRLRISLPASIDFLKHRPPASISFLKALHPTSINFLKHWLARPAGWLAGLAGWPGLFLACSGKVNQLPEAPPPASINFLKHRLLCQSTS
jgi:hypothetical protein